jgi:hypothetical protein
MNKIYTNEAMKQSRRKWLKLVGYISGGWLWPMGVTIRGVYLAQGVVRMRFVDPQILRIERVSWQVT